MLFGVFISAVSQVMLKKAAEREYPSFLAEYLNPLVIISYVIFFAATLCTLFAYKRVPLSLGAVLECTSYVYITVFGVLIFHEKINRKKLIAICMIIIGILLFSF